MGFEKGHKKLGGRSAGIPNKISKEVKGLLKTIVLQELVQAEELIKELSPKDRLNILIHLLPYALPKELEVVSEGYKPRWPAEVVRRDAYFDETCSNDHLAAFNCSGRVPHVAKQSFWDRQ
ncbi:MAG: hypothetical protein ACI959_000663 [Limisphaerales bacterium]|jgi:hypothetical protein